MRVSWMAVLIVFVCIALSLLRRPSETAASAIQRARDLAMRHIGTCAPGSAVVFDFDDTLFDPHVVVDMIHAGTRPFWNGDRRALPLYRPIGPMCDVLRFAASRSMHIVVITARPDTPTTRAIILRNFRKHDLHIHEMHANPHYPEHRDFKAAVRRRIQDAGRPVVLTIGDQWPDVADARGYPWIKLPSRTSPRMITSLSS